MDDEQERCSDLSRMEQGRASSALRQVFGNVSDLRFLISALLIVSGVFPQRCAPIVPSLADAT